jgi:hypothetical protein
MNKDPITIKVSVDDRARFERRGEPVAIGVSLRRSEASSDASWSLVDERGTAVPVQTTILDRWGDQSIRWMLVEFRAVAAPDRPTHYSLVNNSVAIGGQLTVTPSAAGLTVNTGSAQFVVPGSGAVAIAEARVGSHAVLTDLTVAAEGSDGRHYTFAIRKTSIARAGPLTAIVLLEGDLVAADGTPWIESTVTLQFYGRLGAVRVEVSCANARAARHPDGIWDLGDPGSVLIRDLSVTMRPAPRGAASVTASTDRAQPMISSGDKFALYQDSSGGANWQSANHVNRDGRVPTSFRGYRGLVGGREVAGLRATPIASSGTGDSRITIAAPYFWEAFPKSLIVSQETCAVGILPRQFSDSHELQGGERTTFAFVLGVGDDPISDAPLAWTRTPLIVSVDPDAYRRAGSWAPLAVGLPDAQQKYDDMVDGVVTGDSPFSERREIIDEYGWRHFGEIYADHEAVSRHGLISHYNNQYDAIAGMASRFMQTGDARWWSPMCELAAHVTDIDLYRTTGDRAAYNGGHFWHTQHYVDAGTATHRSYSRLSVSSGGGPSNEHNYTTGLLLHHVLTGCHRSRSAVLQLADWVIDMDDGRKSRFRWIDRGATGLASSTRSTDFHGPGRGAGNSINALLDAHRLSGEARYLEHADLLVARCVHPDDDQDALQLLDAENRWSYTVFLQTLGKYLDYRADRGLVDERYAYARDVLLNYARWMSEHERPYLERPEQLEYPTETWAAQDIRKAAVFEFAARHTSDAADRARFLGRAAHFFEYSVNTLAEAATGRLVRPLVLLLAYGFQRPLAPASIEGVAPLKAKVGPRTKFVPMRRRVVRRLVLIATTVSVAVLLTIAWLIF